MQASGGEISGRIYDKTSGEPILLANFKIYQAYGEYDDADRVSTYMKKIMPGTLFTPTSSPMIYLLHFRHVLVVDNAQNERSWLRLPADTVSVNHMGYSTDIYNIINIRGAWSHIRIADELPKDYLPDTGRGKD